MPIVLDPINSVTVSTWTSSTRPSTPSAGEFGFNTTISKFEVWDGSNWTVMG